jgi:hypothetical protein
MLINKILQIYRQHTGSYTGKLPPLCKSHINHAGCNYVNVSHQAILAIFSDSPLCIPMTKQLPMT